MSLSDHDVMMSMHPPKWLISLPCCAHFSPALKTQDWTTWQACELDFVISITK